MTMGAARRLHHETGNWCKVGGVNGVASVIARIIEIVLWLGVAWLVVGAVLLYVNRSAIVVDSDANRVYADSISVSGSFLDVDVYLGRGRMRDEVYYPLVALGAGGPARHIGVFCFGLSCDCGDMSTVEGMGVFPRPGGGAIR